jgi:hypothetical protein
MSEDKKISEALRRDACRMRMEFGRRIECFLIYHAPTRRWIGVDKTWVHAIESAAGCKSWAAGMDAICEMAVDPEECYVLASDVGIEDRLMINPKPYDWRDHVTHT